MKAFILFIIGCLTAVWGIGTVTASAPAGTLNTVHHVTADETWNSDLTIGPGGQVIVSANLAITRSGIQFTGTASGEDPVFLVRGGASLTFTDECAFEAEAMGNRPAVLVENDGRLTFDNSVFRNAHGHPTEAFISVKGGTLQLLNNSSIRNCSYDEPGGSLIRVINGSLEIIRSGIFENTGATGPLENEDPGGIIGCLNTRIAITDSEVTGNTNVGTGVFSISDVSSISISGSVFSNNKSNISMDIRSGIAGVIYAENSTLVIGNDNRFSGNSATSGGAVHAKNCSLEIADGNEFPENEGILLGGALYLERSETVIGKSVFRGNSTGTCGGAVYSDLSELVLNGTSFIENYSESHGGAIDCSGWDDEIGEVFMADLKIDGDTGFIRNKAMRYGGAVSATGMNVFIYESSFIENHCDNAAGALFVEVGNVLLGEDPENPGPLFDGNTAFPEGEPYSGTGGAVYIYSRNDYPSHLVINNADFLNNEAGGGGGATTLYKYRNSSLDAVIHKARFLNNKVMHGTYDQGGGAIMIGPETSLSMNNAAFLGNDAVGAGGAVFSGIGSRTFIRMRNGASFIQNSAGNAPQGYSDLYQMSEEDAFEYSPKMANGGYQTWMSASYQGYRESCTVEGCGILPVSGYVFGAVPSDLSVENAMVLFENNSANSLDSPSAPEELKASAGSGGAIANFGTLIIGEESSSFSLSKSWVETEAQRSYRPSDEAFLESLRLSAAGQAYPFGKVRSVYQDPESGAVYYTSAGDPGIWFILNHTDENVYGVRVEGLPLNTAEGDPIQNWDLSEKSADYLSEVSGDWLNGFEIVNTAQDRPEPGINFFRLVDELKILPQTGL